jgi:hypothetical protein
MNCEASKGVSLLTLIDPSMPDGFFHMRLVPYKSLMVKQGVSFFATKPEPGRESYFETPAGSERGDKRSIGSYLQATDVVRHVLSLWSDQGHGWLQGFASRVR